MHLACQSPQNDRARWSQTGSARGIRETFSTVLTEIATGTNGKCSSTSINCVKAHIFRKKMCENAQLLKLAYSIHNRASCPRNTAHDRSIGQVEVLHRAAGTRLERDPRGRVEIVWITSPRRPRTDAGSFPTYNNPLLQRNSASFSPPCTPQKADQTNSKHCECRWFRNHRI